jgi:hypothetical protein
VKIEAFMASSIHITVMWDVIAYSSVNSHWRFGGTCCFNIGTYLPNYMVSHPRRPSSLICFSFLNSL